MKITLPSWPEKLRVRHKERSGGTAVQYVRKAVVVNGECDSTSVPVQSFHGTCRSDIYIHKLDVSISHTQPAFIMITNACCLPLPPFR